MAKTKTTTLTTRVSEDLAAAYEAVSLIKGIPVGALMRLALEEWVHNHVSPEEIEDELRAVVEQKMSDQLRLGSRAVNGVRSSKDRVPAGGDYSLNDLQDMIG